MSKIVVVGAGASGVVAAIYASKNNDVILLDKNEDICKKILITGNGRCNYFNSDQSLRHYHSSNNDLIKELINDENINKLNNLFDSLGIIPQIKNGYYYPYSNQAKSIKEVLLSKLKECNVKFINNYDVKDIKKENNKFIINNDIVCDKLIMSTGGKSYPKTGSDGFGYKILENFGHKINNVLPALVSVKANEKYLKKLDGVRSAVRASLYENNKFIKYENGEVQLTDYGLSGICIFNLSGYISRGLINNNKEEIELNFLPFIDSKIDFYNWIENRNKVLNKNIYSLFETVLNNKVIDIILELSNIDKNSSYDSLTSKQKEDLANNIISHKFTIINTNSFDKAQVTLGGVHLNDINLNTMESKIVKDLYITGELLDIDGDCGGYNLTLAFLTGILSGENI